MKRKHTDTLLDKDLDITRRNTQDNKVKTNEMMYREKEHSNFPEIRKVYEKSGSLRTIVSWKLGKDEDFIDVRKWFKRVEYLDWRPSIKGICLSTEDWISVIPLISKVIEELSELKKGRTDLK